jgi:hypothetical protein
MPQRIAYDVSTPWDDPFEKQPERRQNGRHGFDTVIQIRVQRPGDSRPLVGPARSEDLSLTGLSALTKHDLRLGQIVTLSIPTEDLGAELCLPDAFIGPAHVVRVTPVESRLVQAAFKFGDGLRSNMDFAIFINALHQRRAS